MLDAHKIMFSELKPLPDGSGTMLTATAEISHVAHIKEGDNPNMDELRYVLTTFIFYKLYGELRGPVMALANLAIQRLSEPDRPEAIRLCSQIMSLISVPKQQTYA